MVGGGGGVSGRELWEGKWRRGKRVCEGKEKAREVEGEKRGRRKEYGRRESE